VASLNAAKTEVQLMHSVRDCFKEFGRLMNVKVFKDWQGRPYAFVQYEAEHEANYAMTKAQGLFLDGRKVRVEKAKVNRSMFISKISGERLERACVKALVGDCELEEVSLLQNPENGEQDVLAYVRFAYREDAVRMFAEYKGSDEWLVEWANLAHRDHPIDRTCLFVGQLNPTTVTEDGLRERFGKYGRMEYCSLVNKQWNQQFPRSAFGFVKYENEESATKAIAAEDGSRWMGRHMRVQYKELRESGRGGGRRRGHTALAGPPSYYATPPAVEEAAADDMFPYFAAPPPVAVTVAADQAVLAEAASVHESTKSSTSEQATCDKTDTPLDYHASYFTPGMMYMPPQAQPATPLGGQQQQHYFAAQFPMPQGMLPMASMTGEQRTAYPMYAGMPANVAPAFYMPRFMPHAEYPQRFVPFHPSTPLFQAQQGTFHHAPPSPGTIHHAAEPAAPGTSNAEVPTMARKDSGYQDHYATT